MKGSEVWKSGNYLTNYVTDYVPDYVNPYVTKYVIRPTGQIFTSTPKPLEGCPVPTTSARLDFPAAFPLRNEPVNFSLPDLPCPGNYRMLITTYTPALVKTDSGVLDAGVNTYVWDGRLPDGSALDPLFYYVVFTSTALPSQSVAVLGGTPKVENFRAEPLVFNAKNNETSDIKFNLSTQGKVTIRMFDENKNLVRILPVSPLPLAPGPLSLAWDGKDASGNVMPDGVYTAEITTEGLTGGRDKRFVSVWVHAPRIRGITNNSVFGTMNPGDGTQVFLDNLPLEIHEIDAGLEFMAQFTSLAQGRHTIKLKTSKGYEVSQDFYFTEIKELQTQNFNVKNNEGTQIKFHLTAPDTVFVNIGKGTPESIGNIPLPQSLNLNNLPEQLQDLAKVAVNGLGPFNLQAGLHEITWDGKDFTGNRVPPGVYTISVYRFTEGRQYSVLPVELTTVDAFDGAVISNVQAEATGVDTVRITWSTDVEATSQIEYGGTDELGTFTTEDPAMTISHIITLSDLIPGESVFFKVHSKDGSGKASVSQLFTFTLSQVLAEGNLAEPAWKLASNQILFKSQQLLSSNFQLPPSNFPFGFDLQGSNIACHGCCGTCPKCPPPCPPPGTPPEAKVCCAGTGGGAGACPSGPGPGGVGPKIEMWLEDLRPKEPDIEIVLEDIKPCAPSGCPPLPCVGESRSECFENCTPNCRIEIGCVKTCLTLGTLCPFTPGTPLLFPLDPRLQSASCAAFVVCGVYCITKRSLCVIDCDMKCSDKPCR